MSTRLPKLFCSVLTFACLWIAQASGAEIERIGNRLVRLSGQIETGDVDRLKALRLDSEATITFDSTGGNFAEGLAIAKFIFEQKISTTVSRGARCLSSCAIAFLGGAALGEESSVLAARSIASGGILGFHGPFLELGAGQFSEEHVESYYDRAVHRIVDLVSSSNYLQIDFGDAAELMRPQRRDLLFIDNADLLGRYGIVPQEVEMPASLTDTMVASMCANGWNWAHNSRMKDITAFEYPNVFQDAVSLIQTTKWDGQKNTISVADNAKATVVPLTRGREGQTLYCVIDQNRSDEGIYVSCRGFFGEESSARARAYVKSDGEMQYSCGIGLHIDPVAGYDKSFFNVAWALVPPDTLLVDMKAKLEELVENEPKLPRP